MTSNGHVGIVYDIEADGRIDYMDAHPDFSVTRRHLWGAVRPKPGAPRRRYQELAPDQACGCHEEADGKADRRPRRGHAE